MDAVTCCAGVSEFMAGHLPLGPSSERLPPEEVSALPNVACTSSPCSGAVDIQ